MSGARSVFDDSLRNDTVKKTRTPSQIQASSAARKRALFVAAAALIAGTVVLTLSNYFLQLHCVIAMAVALAGGLAAARATIPIDPDSFRSAGNVGGTYAALAYVLPFIGFSFYNWMTMTPDKAAQRMTQLSSAEIVFAQQNNMQLGVEYFRGQDIAYLFGYLLFALILGSVLGMVGGAVAKRQLTTR